MFKPKIVAGSKYSIVVSASGKAYSWGTGDDGNLGLGKIIPLCVKKPKLIDDLKNEIVVDVDTLYRSSYFVCKSGILYVCGENGSGQLFLDRHKINSVSRPTLVKSLSHEHIIKVKSGDFHVIVLCDSGYLYGAGSNSYGEGGVGIGDKKMYGNTHIPRKVDFFVKNKLKIADFACGTSATYFLTECGCFYTVGGNSRGELMRETSENEDKRRIVTKVNLFGETDTRFSSFSAGFSHVIAITKDKRIIGSGYNEWNQLSIHNERITSYRSDNNDHIEPFDMSKVLVDSKGKKLSVCRVFAKGNTSFFECFDGTIWGMGRNNLSQLSFIEGVAKKKPSKIQVPMKFETEISRQGIEDIDMGYYHGLLLTKKYILYFSGKENMEEYGEKGDYYKYIKIELDLMDVARVIKIERNEYNDIIIELQN